MSERSELIREAIQAGGETLLQPPGALTRGPAGITLGTGSGSSIDFHDFREYQPGDDLRRVDWGAYARGSGLMLRLYREEISPVAEIVLDTSTSMAIDPAKEATALAIAAFLTGAARRSEGRPILITHGQRHPADAVESGLGRCTFESRTPPVPSTGGTHSAKPLRYLISDFLFPGDGEEYLRGMARGAACLFPIQVLTAEERDPSLRGGAQLIDCEDETHQRELYIDATAVQQYRDRLARHIQRLDHGARGLESSLTEIIADDSDTRLESVKDTLLNNQVVTTK
ncbi:MAG: DUF58 domain-containing protein [Planctomycetota bacterium]|jgi:uncharacterized protein (DUF58 family)